MLTRNFRYRRGFTLIEIIVVIAILAILAGVSYPLLTSRINAANVTGCQNNVKQILQLGMKYSDDMMHRNLLPTSGMDDDEDTREFNEKAAWWYSIAPQMDQVIYPKNRKEVMQISTIFHCPGDNRAQVDGDLMPGDAKHVSYVSWTDGSEDADNPNSCISMNKQRLDELPWISDGIPELGKSVKNIRDFKKMVLPALERHDSTIVVGYASGLIKAHELDSESTDVVKAYKQVAPWLYEQQKKGGKRK
ncbi:MAG: prepilin-type N-terminal cleavage/methylation domain-containing protein [Akkermansia sp.]